MLVVDNAIFKDDHLLLVDPANLLNECPLHGKAFPQPANPFPAQKWPFRAWQKLPVGNAPLSQSFGASIGVPKTCCSFRLVTMPQ